MPGTELTSTSTLTLSDHHRALDRRFSGLLEQAIDGNTIELRCEWLLFERELDEHMSLEETELLPQLARLHPAEASALRKEHAHIRSALAELGIALDLHTLRADSVAAFVVMLRDHARREERLLYPYAAMQTDLGPLATVLRRLSALSEGIANAL